MRLMVLRSAYVRLPVSPRRAYPMGMPAQDMVWTAEMARALPDDGNRYEVLDGELFVTPVPSGYHPFSREASRVRTGGCAQSGRRS
jgi:hypothetical protein